MIRFFNAHFPSRILFLILIASLGAVTFILLDYPYSENILRWMMIGEKVADGHLVYKHVWMSEGPLFAWLSAFVFGLFQRSYISFSIFGLILILLQALNFTGILNQTKILKNRSYLPALIYILFFFTHYQLIGFTPELLGMTFILIAFRIIVLQQKSDRAAANQLNIGLLLGIAILCSSIYVYFIPLFLISIISLSSISARSFFLWLGGLLLPLFLVMTFMYLNEGLSYFNRFFLFRIFHFTNTENINIIKLLGLTGCILIPILAGILRSFSDSSAANFIEKLKRLFLLWFITSLLVMAIHVGKLDIRLISLLCVPFSYYCSIFISGWKKQALAELVFVLIFAGLIGAGIYLNTGIYNSKPQEPAVINERGKHVYYFEGSLALYENQKLGTVFVDRALTEKYLRYETPEELISVYQAFNVDQPLFVIDDKEEHFKTILQRIPLLREDYLHLGNGVYKCLKDKQ